MTLMKEKIKAWLGPLWWYSAVMFCVGRFGDLINLYTGLWLVPKWVSQAELGALLPLGQLGGMLGLPLAVLLTPFMKFLNAFGAKGEIGKVKALLYDALVLSGISAFAIMAYTWFMAPLAFERLRISGTGLIWLLCGSAVTLAFIPILNSGLSALKLFRCMGVVGLASAPVRLFFLLALLPAYGLAGFFSSQVLSNVVALVISFWGLRKIMSCGIGRESYRSEWREMVRYTVPIAGIMMANNISSTAQLLIIRQRLPDVESAAFYFLSRFAEIPNVAWSAIAVVFFPIVSEAFEKGKDTRRILVQVLLFTVGGGALVAVALGLGIEWLFGVVPKWHDYQPYAGLMVWMAMTNVFRVAFACFSNHEMACRRFGYIAYYIPIALFEAGMLVSLTGYGFFVPYLPPSWIEWIAALRPSRLEFIVKVMWCSTFAIFLGLILQMLFFRPCAKRASD